MYKLSTDTAIKISQPTTTPSVASEIKLESSSKVKIFNIGETAIGTNLKLTVNGVRFANRIDYIDNIYGPTAFATEGKEYVIIDITVENTSPELQRPFTLTESEVIDGEGYSYSWDLYSYAALEDKHLTDGEIPVGMKRRGEIPYLIPKDANDLKFISPLDVLGKEIIIFIVKDAKN